MPRKYQYIKISNYYFCLQQNPVVLAWILFFRRSDLCTICTPWLITDPDPAGDHNTRLFFWHFKKNVTMLLFFSLSKFRLRDAGPTIDLLFYGHLCKHVHKGFKIFNLIKGTVVKVFDPDVSMDSIGKEVKLLERVSEITFSPSLIRSDTAERWYEEEYVSGTPISTYKSPEFSTLLRSFDEQIISCLSDLMSYMEKKSVRTADYARELMERKYEGCSSSPMVKKDVLSRVESFNGSLMEHLGNRKNPIFYLVFSHGDFCPANMIITKGGLKVLDWESAFYRSALFDFFSYFFYRPVCIDVPVDVMACELRQSLPLFISRLSPRHSELARHLSTNESLYRWIFYLEYMCKLLDRAHTDNNLNINDFIIRYIEAFIRYETVCAGGDSFRPRTGITNMNPST